MTRRIETLGDEFASLFTSFRHTAFRLETLQSYDVEYEQEMLRRFLAGSPRPADPAKDEWTAMLARAAADGKTMRRVHVVTEPLSDYVRFELSWSYGENVTAGEDIRILPTPTGQWPAGVPTHDYWLFDSRELWIMHYGPGGTFHHAELVEDPAQVVQHCYWRDHALHLAAPFTTYMTMHPELEPANA